jgi:fucose permease
VVPHIHRSPAVSILFFLWGFAYGLLDTLNAQIQVLLGYTQGHTIALFNAYWIAYFFGPLVCGYWVLKRQGFKATFMTGLAIYSVGAMSFWPSSVLRSFPGFFISNFIVALGLSCLEVAANPFIALAGPGELSEARLNFSQGFQAIGSVVSPLLASKALFSGIGEEDLFRVQWCYLAVAIFVVFLAVVFFYVPLSEASDDDLEAMALQRLYNAGMDKGEKTFRVGARRLLLWTGVFVMMCYVGAQECVSYFWTPFLQDADPDSELFWDRTISRSVFAFGRFLAAGLAYCGLPPRIILGFHMIGAFTASILAMVLPQGNGALGMLILIIFFESAIFPTVFAMTLRGQGRHTKMASAALTMAISGGSIWPSAVYGINKSHPGNMRYAMRIPIVLFAVSMPWPVILSSTRVLRRWVDPIWSKRRFVGGGEQGSLTVDWSSPPHQHKPFTAHLETTPGRMDGSASQHGKKGTGERKPSISIIT